MEKELLNSIQVQEFLTDYEENSTIELLEEGGKEENELFQIAEARGILLKGSRDLAGFKTIYTFADKANGNKARLPKKILLKALPGIVGKPVDIDHQRNRVIGYYIDYKYIVKEELVIAYGIIFKSNFAEEWKTCQQLFKDGKLTSSYEIWCPKSKRHYLADGTYELTEQEVAGGAILFKTKPAFADAHVLEMAKVNDEDLEFANKNWHPCSEMIVCGETICRKCGKCENGIEEAKLLGQPVNPQLPSPIKISGKNDVGTKPDEVPEFRVSDKQKPDDKDVVGQKPRYIPPHSIASKDGEVACPHCGYVGIPQKKVIGDATNTYIRQGCLKCGGLLDNISTPFSAVKCANCSYIIDKPFITTSKEISCPECKAILNDKGETKYPPQHIDFKMSCPSCSSRNWRILKSDKKNADIKCMSCNKAYKIEYQEDPKATVMSNMHFLHVGTVPCAQCGHRVSYAGTSKNRKYEVSCGECNLKFSHDITNEMIRRIGSINEMTDADYETKYGQPSDLQDISQPRKNFDPTPINKTDKYMPSNASFKVISKEEFNKASLIEFIYKINETTDVVLEGKIITSDGSNYTLEVAGYEGIFIVNEKELISTADELIDKSAKTVEIEGEQKMEKKDVKVTTPAEIESPVEASLDDSYEEGFEVAKKLTSEARNALSDKDFAVVIHKDGKTIRKYPIKDQAHVRNALSRLGQDAPKAGLKALGVSPESVRAKVLRKAKDLGMHEMLKREDADICATHKDSYDTDIMEDKGAEKVAQKLIKSYDRTLFEQDKNDKEKKMAEEEEKKESVVEEKKEEKENIDKADKPTVPPTPGDDAEKQAEKLRLEADLKSGKPDMQRDKADLKTGKPDMNRELADLKSGKPDMQRDLANKEDPANKDLTGREKPTVNDVKITVNPETTADLKTPVADEKHTNVADLKKPVANEKHPELADLKKPVADEKHTDVADLKGGKPDMNRNIADLKGGKPDMNRNIADLKSGKPDMQRNIAEYKGYDAPTTDDNAEKLAEKLAMAKSCIARHLASLKKAHKKIQESKRMSKANLELASFYKENGEEISKRQKEVGLEIAGKISDRDILDNSKFADLKLEKANLNVSNVVGSKSAQVEDGDHNKELRAEIDAKAFGRVPRKS